MPRPDHFGRQGQLFTATRRLFQGRRGGTAVGGGRGGSDQLIMAAAVVEAALWRHAEEFKKQKLI